MKTHLAALAVVLTLAGAAFAQPAGSGRATGAGAWPAKTPKPIIDRISTELVRIIRSDEVRNRMRGIYFQALGTTPEGLASLMREEVERWGKIIKQTGAKAD